MLKNLLLSIIECRIDATLISDVLINILDNDLDKTASSIIEELSYKVKQPFNLYYSHFPVKGLANVRNELLKKALGQNTQFIIFIDDDEYPDSEWLNELLTTIITNNADMALGPVIPVFDNNVSKSVSYWFERQHFTENSRIKTLATNNLILKIDSLQKYNVWFDSRFNFTGSEDSYFGMQMRKKGAITYWAANAIVYENIPEERTHLFWLMKRKYRGATNFIYKLKLEKQYFKILLKTVYSFIYIFSGIIALLLLIFPIKWRLWGLLKVSEGVGGVAGILNHRPTEY